MKKIGLLMLLICTVLTETRGQIRTAEIGFLSENDSFLGQGSDRYYTNGFFLFFRKAQDTLRRRNRQVANQVFELELGQKIFNAQSGSLPAVRYVDRPIAGYLYLSAAKNTLYSNEGNIKLSGSLGIVGPAAGGYVIQKFIHDTFGFYQLNTWQYQVQNDIQINLKAEGNSLLARNSWSDLTATGYIALGTGFTGAGLGPLVRLGHFNQLFQSASTQSTVSQFGDSRLIHKKEFFFFIKPMVSGVVYDATIQGSLFRNHPVEGTEEITLEKRPLLLSNQLGISYVGNRVIINTGMTAQTTDTKETTHSTHQWGSVSLLYRLN